MDRIPCSHCHAQPKPGVGGHLRCSKCRIAFFCSRKCQKADWPEHKLRCKYIAEKTFKGRPLSEGVYPKYVLIASRRVEYAAGLPKEEMQAAVRTVFEGLSRAGRAALAMEALWSLNVEVLQTCLSFTGKLGFSTTIDVIPAAHVTTTRLSRFLTAIGPECSLFAHTLELLLYVCGDPERSKLLACLDAIAAATPVSELNRSWPKLSYPDETSALTDVCQNANAALKVDVVRILLARGSSPSSDEMRTAIWFCSSQELQLLVDAGGIARFSDPHGLSLLHVLASFECPDTAAKLRVLLNAGCDLEAVDKDGNTPLVYTIGYTPGSLAAFDALVAAGADVSKLGGLHPSVSKFRDGSLMPVMCTLLQKTAHLNDVGGVRRLLDRSLVPSGIIDINFSSQNTFDWLDQASALGLACLNDNPVIAQLLLDAGAEMVSSLLCLQHMAVTTAVNFGAKKCFDVLVKAGALDLSDMDVDFLITTAHMAVMGFKLLQALPPDQQCRMPSGRTVAETHAVQLTLLSRLEVERASRAAGDGQVVGAYATR